MNTEFVLFLREIPKTTDAIALVGGKAHNLARLIQAGFAVPQGFCLTTHAYRRHLAAHGLTDQMAETLARTDYSPADKTARIRQIITGVGLPLDVHDALVGAYRELTAGDPTAAVAVRSSALAEDAIDASFAGQHDTFLNVRGELALLESIKRCWASLWTARSQSYRARLRPDDPGAALAVIVQRMAPAERAGVVFTIDPVTGADEIVLEAVPGLGERLVSGSITPDRYRVDKRTWKVRQASPARQGHAILNPNQLGQIARLAAQVEHFFGQPQDIEWALGGAHIYLLQSRPVPGQCPVPGRCPVPAMPRPDFVTEDGQVDMAALLDRADEIGGEIWTDDNVGEVIPGVVTPLSWSVLEPLGNGAFRRFLRRVGVRRYPEAGLFGRFFGRVYFNQSQFQRLMSRFYPSHLAQSGGRSRPVALIRAALALAETGLRALLLILILPREVERAIKTVPAELKRAPNPQTLTGRDLSTETERWQEIGQRAMSTHLAVTIFASLLYELLPKLVSRRSGGELETAHLMTGLPGMKSAEMGRDLAALAETAAETDLRALLLNTPPEALSDCLAALPADHRFHRELEQFLEKHGHAGLREFELAFPRWREDVGYVLALVQNHLRARRPPDSEAQWTSRRRATAALRRRLRFGPRRLFFEILLRWTQVYSVARENMKYTFVMAHSHLRELYLVLAQRLVEQDALAEAADLFYLTQDEIESFLFAQIKARTLAETAARRRAEYLRQRKAQAKPPKIIEQRADGSLHPLTLAENGDMVATDETTLRGVAASAGRVTGRARVILEPANSARLEPGEILVAPSTNPSWAPLLLNAGGLITEIGGLLSHGAIVAREYGLPAVLNVKGATQAIRTGQRLIVDGYAGTVRILNES